MSRRNTVLISLGGIVFAIALIFVASVSGWVAAAVTAITGGPTATPKVFPSVDINATPCAVNPTIGPNGAGGLSCRVTAPGALGPSPTQAAASVAPSRTGVPAVQPRIANADALTPAITVQDVTDYVMTHPASLGKIGVQGPFTVESVAFLSAQQIDQQLNTSVGVAPDTLLCLVKAKGTFVSVSPPDANNVSHEITYHTWYLILDAHTGNLLLQNARP